MEYKVLNSRYLQIRPSTIAGAGSGVFAGVDIAKGEMLRVTGFRVRKGSLSDRCTHFADPYKFRLGRDLLIPTGYGGLINHSQRPNLVKIITGEKVFLKVLRRINAGEELFHRYRQNAKKWLPNGIWGTVRDNSVSRERPEKF